MYSTRPSSTAGGRGRAPSSTPGVGRGGGGPSFAQIQASYAALMDDDSYIPPTAAPPPARRTSTSSFRGGAGNTASTANTVVPRVSLQQRSPSAGLGAGTSTRGRGTTLSSSRGTMSGGSVRGGFHFQPTPSTSTSSGRRGSGGGATAGASARGSGGGDYDPSNYKLDTLMVRDGSDGNSTSLSQLPVAGNDGAGGGRGNGLTQWTLPNDNGGGQSSGGGGGGIHNGFFYNDNLLHEFNSDDDDVNNNALYYGDEQLRTGVTKKGTVAMSPGKIRRTQPQSEGGDSSSSSPMGVRGMNTQNRRSSESLARPSDSYQQSIVSSSGAQKGMSTVDVLNNEHRMTAKGRQVREDVDGMMDMYYGNGGINEYNNLESYNKSEGIGEKRHGSGVSDAQALASCTAPRSANTLMSKPQMLINRMNPAWNRGPKNEEGRIYDASDRNLLCMDVRGDSAVVGSADHGLKVFDIKTMRERRNLYGKKCGHTEWVTSVVYLPDGRILSGGMDSKLCLWHATALKCDDLLGHTGSVSQVDTSPNGIAVSASYDRTLRVWNVKDRPSCLTTLVGHSQPVMNFAWTGPMVMSGDRRGTVKVWDLDTSACAATYETRGGQIGSLGHLIHPDMGQISAVGDQKGTVCIFDFRRSGAEPIFSQVLHPGGVVSGIKGMPLAGNGGLIVTAGADRAINILEPRMNFKTVHAIKDHKDFIYSMETYGDLIISGGGNGWLLVHDSKTGKCLYGLGANAAAVRCIFPSADYLVAAGDDGKAMVYDF